MTKQLLMIAFLVLMYMQAKAQKQSQVWMDYKLHIPFAERFTFYNTVS